MTCAAPISPSSCPDVATNISGRAVAFGNQAASARNSARPLPRSPAQWNQPLFGVDTTIALPCPARRPTTLLAACGDASPVDISVTAEPAAAACASGPACAAPTSTTGTGQAKRPDASLSAMMPPVGPSVTTTTASAFRAIACITRSPRFSVQAPPRV